MSFLLAFELFRRNTFAGRESGPYPNKRMTCHGDKKPKLSLMEDIIKVIQLKKE
jgi:hypothetical protein